MNTIPWLILWIPFAVAAVIFFTGMRSKISGWLATGGLLIDFILTLVLFAQQHGQSVPLESSFTWIAAGAPIEFGVLVNGLSLLMLLIVTGIGTLIFLYSMAYMEHDAGYSRYFASLSLFAFSMLGIVLSNNLIQIFIFWELVGLSSYLLIGFWFEKPDAATAGKKAFITTRVGDVGMMIGILMLFGYLAAQNLGTFNFLKIQAALPQAAIPAGALTVISLLIFMGVAGKSAQMPLHVWLPDAMEGPTPVSALIHAATMVASGIFLLTRLNFIFLTSETALHIIAWIGGITSLVAGTIGFSQNDIKKVLAYSTLSQLGLMVMAVGLKNSEAGMFHLTTHAFFKALLFLGSGNLIHAMHTQNIWEMDPSPSPLSASGERGLIKSMPITSWTFFIGTLALIGIPPFSGYFSKEEILAAAHSSPPLFILSLAVVFCTAFYMGRLCTIVFFRKAPLLTGPGGGLAPLEIHESGWKMTLPLIILAVLSVIGGFLPIRELVIASEAKQSAFQTQIASVVALPRNDHDYSIALISIGLALAGFFLAFILYIKKKSSADEFKGVLQYPKRLFDKKYFFDDFYDTVVIGFFQEGAAKISDAFERIVVVEGGVNGTARLTRKLGDTLRKLQTGGVQSYAFVFTIGITLILFYFLAANS